MFPRGCTNFSASTSTLLPKFLGTSMLLCRKMRITIRFAAANAAASLEREKYLPKPNTRAASTGTLSHYPIVHMPTPLITLVVHETTRHRLHLSRSSSRTDFTEDYQRVVPWNYLVSSRRSFFSASTSQSLVTTYLRRIRPRDQPLNQLSPILLRATTMLCQFFGSNYIMRPCALAYRPSLVGT